MKSPIVFTLLLPVVLLLGCLEAGMGANNKYLRFQYHRDDNRRHEVGTWGTGWYVGVWSHNHSGPFRAKYDFSGSGKIFRIEDGSSGTPVLVPINTSLEYVTYASADEYFPDYLGAHYMPPTSNDDLPSNAGDAVSVRIAIEVFNPETKKWENSLSGDSSGGEYLSVWKRYTPGDYYLQHNGTGGTPENQPTSATVKAGGVYEFLFDIRNPKPGYDLQIQHDLTAQGGYSGNKGQLTVVPHESTTPPVPPDYFTCTYTAPSGITSPVDIVATISYYDIWVKERRSFDFTFHVVP